jgi:FkbM family methyltransferase
MNFNTAKFIRGIRPVELGVLLKALLNVKRVDYQLPTQSISLSVDAVSDFGLRILETGHYEEYLEKILQNILQKGDFFIDLGANEGYFSIFASALVGTEGKVLAIEPQERLWSVITRNIMLNKCDNLQLIPYAIDTMEHFIEIILYPSINTGASSLVTTARNKLYKRQTVKTRSLDDIIVANKLTTVKLVKIDIEGFEFIALKSAQESLKKKIIKYIALELHPIQLAQMGSSSQEVIDYLASFGYHPVNGHTELFTCE